MSASTRRSSRCITLSTKRVSARSSVTDPALPATGSGDRAGVLLALGALLVAGGAAVLALSQRRTPGRHAA